MSACLHLKLFYIVEKSETVGEHFYVSHIFENLEGLMSISLDGKIDADLGSSWQKRKRK
jgi:hypothetical protein